MALSYEKPSGAAPLPRNTDAPPIRMLATYRRDPEATLPPTPLRELLASSGARICVLSTDTALIDIIARAAGDQYPISVVQEWFDLQAAADSGECGIALLDASLLGDRTIERVRALAPFAQRLVTLVAVDRSTASDFVGLLGDRKIHRLLMKPAAVGATRLLIESAVTRRLELRELHANDTAAAAAGEGGVTRAQRWTIGVAAGIVLLGAGAGVAWWELRERAAPPLAASVAAPAVDSQAEARRQVEDLRAQADLALSEGRLSDASGTGALEQYLAILELAPNDASARNGAAAVVETLFTRAEESLLAASLDEAAETLDRIRRVEPSSTRLAFLDAQLVRALAGGTSGAPAVAGAALPEQQPGADAAPSEIDSTLTLAAARLRRGQLLSPAGDNARDYLDRARELDATNAQAAALRAELAAALVATARLVVASDPVAASSIAAEARRQGAAASALTALETEVTASRRNLAQREDAASLGTARELIRQGALFSPPSSHALAALLRIQSDSPETEGLASAWAEFRVATRGAVETAAARGDSAVVDAGLAALREAPEGAAVADQLMAEFAARKQQERYLATAMPSSELRLVSAPPAVYPADLIQAGVEGWVDVEFIVDAAGNTRDGVVVDARPRNRFDAAALAAVAAYQYAPFQADGRVYERRVRVRIRFVLR